MTGVKNHLDPRKCLTFYKKLLRLYSTIYPKHFILCIYCAGIEVWLFIIFLNTHSQIHQKKIIFFSFRIYAFDVIIHSELYRTNIAHKVLICVSKFSVKRAKIGKRTAGFIWNSMCNATLYK